MLFGEPPRSQADLHFPLFGIPVRVHPFFWLVGVLLVFRQLTDSEQVPNLQAALGILLPWLVAFFLSILIHELGHAVLMRRYGFSPWITLYGFGGMASYGPPGSYGSRGLGTWPQVLISAAGPGAGFILAAVVVGIVVLTGHQVGIFWVADFLPLIRPAEIIGSMPLTEFVDSVLFISIFWGVVNLLPVYPLDGGNIARELLLKISPRDGIRQSLILSIATGGLLAVVGLVQMKSLLMAIFFGYLAYSSYTTLQAYSGRRPW